MTKNRVFDGQVSICNNRVGWVSGNVWPTQTSTQVFFGEGKEIKQLSNSLKFQYNINVGQKYVVWIEADEILHSAKKRLLYYDGKKTQTLDEGYINTVQTAGDYILFSKRDDPYSNAAKQYIFNGLTNELLPFHTYTKGETYSMIMTEKAIIYTVFDSGKYYLFAYDYHEHTFIDSSKYLQIYWGGHAGGFFNDSDNLSFVNKKHTGNAAVYFKGINQTKEAEYYFYLNGSSTKINFNLNHDSIYTRKLWITTLILYHLLKSKKAKVMKAQIFLLYIITGNFLSQLILLKK